VFELTSMVHNCSIATLVRCHRTATTARGAKPFLSIYLAHQYLHISLFVAAESPDIAPSGSGTFVSRLPDYPIRRATLTQMFMLFLIIIESQNSTLATSIPSFRVI
jgi:hypothetical protein